MKKLFNFGIRKLPIVLLAVAAGLATWERFPGSRRMLLGSVAQKIRRMWLLVDLSSWGVLPWFAISISALLLAASAHGFPRLRRHLSQRSPQCYGKPQRIITSRPLFASIGILFILGVAVFWWRRTTMVSQPEVGFLPQQMVADDGSEQKYLIFVPHEANQEPGKKLPVLLFLNGAGEKGSDGFSQLSNNLGRPIWEMQNSFPLLLVAPQCNPLQSWTDTSAYEKALEILDHVIDKYPVDRDRVYLTGVSAGASGVLKLPPEVYDRFAAVVTVACAEVGDPIEIARNLHDIKIPIWCFYNRDDGPNEQFNQQLTDALWQNGVEFGVTAYARGGHDAWNYAYRDPAMYRWLLAHRRASVGASEPSFRPIDEAHASWSGDGVLQWDVMLKTPQTITINAIADDNPRSTRTKRYHLSTIDEPFENNEISVFDEKAVIKDAGNLLGRLAVRKSSLNHLSLTRRGHSITLEVNGWPLFDSPMVIDQDTAAIAVLFDSPNGGIESNDSEQNPRRRWLRLRCRPEDQRVIIAKQTPDRPITKAGSAHIAVTTAGEVSDRLRERASKAKYSRIDWYANNRLENVSKKSSLLIRDSTVVYQTAARHIHIVQRVSEPSLPQERMLDFNTGISKIRFGYKQNVVWPLTDWTRTATDDGWTDRWEGTKDSAVVLSKTDDPWGNSTRWARLTMEPDLDQQLNALQGQAAIMAIGRLNEPLLNVKFDHLELFAAREMIDGYACHLVAETSDSDTVQRRFWVDIFNGGLIRRFQGKVPTNKSDQQSFSGKEKMPDRFDSTFIEIQYDRKTFDPTGWTVVTTQSPESPIMVYGSGEVTRIE